MDTQNDVLTTATLITTLLGILAMVIKQLALPFVKRIKSKWESDELVEKKKAETEAAEDKLSIEAKSFLTEAAKDHLDTIRTMAQECKDEVKELHKEVNELRIERAALQAKDEIRLEEIQRIRNDYIEAKSNLNETKQQLDNTTERFDRQQEEMSNLRLEVDRMRNQISVFETRLMSEQQNSRIIEKRLESAEAELRIKDEMLKESKQKNEIMQKEMRELQNKLREYAAKLNVVETTMENNANALDTRELIARNYDELTPDTLPTRPPELDSKIEEKAKEKIEAEPPKETEPVKEDAKDTTDTSEKPKE